MVSDNNFKNIPFSCKMTKQTRYTFAFIFLFGYSINAQKAILKLDSIQNLLTSEVRSVITEEISNKRVIFLGESEHHIGSDFLAKTEFVKFLVKEHNYKNIAFESDFFALYYEHYQNNTFPHWANSTQCQELFQFLKENNVVIWGFDNQFSTPYSFRNFSLKLFNFLKENNILPEEKFNNLVDVFMKTGKATNKDVKYMISEIDILLHKESILNDPVWHQFIESFRSTVLQYTSSSRKIGITLRDAQMAKNLAFITSQMSNDKFIVWAANAHISKLNDDYMHNQTMGYQYNQLNPDSSFHIAFAPIKMAYRSDKFIAAQRTDPNNLLSLLPDISHNYFISSKLFLKENPIYKDVNFKGMFGIGNNLDNNKINLLKHFDALIFIANGEKVKY